jgi:hypothetical protein
MMQMFLVTKMTIKINKNIKEKNIYLAMEEVTEECSNVVFIYEISLLRTKYIALAPLVACIFDNNKIEIFML